MSFSASCYSPSILWFCLPLAKRFWLHNDIFNDVCDNAVVSDSTEVDFIFHVFPFDISGIVVKKNSLQRSAGCKFRCEDLNYIRG